MNNPKLLVETMLKMSQNDLLNIIGNLHSLMPFATAFLYDTVVDKEDYFLMLSFCKDKKLQEDVCKLRQKYGEAYSRLALQTRLRNEEEREAEVTEQEKQPVHPLASLWRPKKETPVETEAEIEARIREQILKEMGNG